MRDLILPARIGVWAEEHGRSQRVRVSLDLTVKEGPPPAGLDDVVRYDLVVDAVRRLVAAGHISLVETLADRVASLCLDDPRVKAARVRIEKLDVYSDAGSVGVEIERMRA